MKIKTVFLTGLILSLVTMFFLASKSENGDTNAISMYYVVFLIPIILLVLLNTLFVKSISRFKNRNMRLFTSFLPLCILIALFQLKNLTISFIDGNLVFATLTGAIALGITNILWISSTYLLKQTN